MGSIISSVYNRLFSQKSMRILMEGLDGAGKTTILYRLKLGETVTTIPSISSNIETVEYKNMSFTIWDCGGGDKIRKIWKHYFPNIDGIIFVVDSNDTDRIEEARLELHSILEDPNLKQSMLLIFANKQDLQTSMSIAEITDKLGLNTLKNTKWCIQETCATQGNGLNEGFDWLSTTWHQQQSNTK